MFEEILDVHFPHSYYAPNGDYTKPKIHDRDCQRCEYDERIEKAVEEYTKQLLEEYTNRIVENVTATLYRSENDERLDDAVVDKESITSQLEPFIKSL